MSHLKDRLHRLRKKTRRKKKPSENPAPEAAAAAEAQERCDDEDGEGTSPRQEVIRRLREMIRTAERRSGAGTPAEPESNGLLTPVMPEGPGQRIEDLLPGGFVETEYGSCFRVVTRYPWQYHQGNTALSTLLDCDPGLFGWLVNDERLRRVDFTKTLFFDTETTGLDTGSGVYIFLAGVGYFRDRAFIVEQYFMRDFPEEPAVLSALASVFARFETIVTYNGKTYDWPLLETRFIINRQTLPLRNPPHLDLLHAGRRLFKYRLESCKLAELERGVLGFQRVDDIPGALLPDLYFRYVRSRDARFIQKAFAHNAHDIVSMAVLAARMLIFLEDILEAFRRDRAEEYPGPDLYALARLAEDRGHIETSIRLYRLSLERGLHRPLHREALRRLSLSCKRLKRWDEALDIWRLMIQTDPGSGVFPFEEIAKYYEHTERNFDAAIKVVRDALDESVFRGLSMDERAGLEYRLNRLVARKEGRFRRRGAASGEP